MMMITTDVNCVVCWTIIACDNSFSATHCAQAEQRKLKFDEFSFFCLTLFELYVCRSAQEDCENRSESIDDKKAARDCKQQCDDLFDDDNADNVDKWVSVLFFFAKTNKIIVQIDLIFRKQNEFAKTKSSSQLKVLIFFFRFFDFYFF